MAAPVTFASLVADGGRSSGGGGVSFRQLWTVFSTETVANATATVESTVANTSAYGTIVGFDSAEFVSFGCYVSVASTGTPTLAVIIQQSWDDTAANYVPPSAASTVAVVVTTTAQVFNITPTPMPKLRIQAAGGAGAPTDMTITMRLWMSR